MIPDIIKKIYNYFDKKYNSIDGDKNA